LLGVGPKESKTTFHGRDNEGVLVKSSPRTWGKKIGTSINSFPIGELSKDVLPLSNRHTPKKRQFRTYPMILKQRVVKNEENSTYETLDQRLWAVLKNVRGIHT